MGIPLYRHVRHALANRGVLGNLHTAIQRLARTLRHKRRANRADKSSASGITDRANVIHPFDLAYAVDTSGLIEGQNLPTPHPNAFWSTAYYAIAPSIFDQLIQELEFRLAPDWSAFTFLDLGSGKGRALMLASRLPFRAILGVEISPELARICRRNLLGFSAPWQQCRALEAREGDVTSFDLPSTPLVIYLYHPFAAPTLEAFLGNLERSLQNDAREILLLYFNPALDHVLARHPAFERQFLYTFTMHIDDALADRFCNDKEAVAVYSYIPAAASAERGRRFN
jgi:SAM-dependent methyltransferase